MVEDSLRQINDYFGMRFRDVKILARVEFHVEQTGLHVGIATIYGLRIGFRRAAMENDVVGTI